MTSSAGALSATARLHTAFGKPIYQRCVDISKMILDTSVKELHTVLPLLLESIFGYNNQLGWGIGRLTKSQYQEFNTLRKFLSPHGQLMDLIHKLLQDPYCRYEFPLSCIPYPSRHTLMDGGMCAFYASKVQFHQGNGRPYNMLSLNAFELYFFHFAYFLVNPNAQKMSSWNSPTDSLYPVLLEDYLCYYLPPDGTKVPAIPHVAQPIRSPIAHQSPIHRAQAISSPSGTPGRLNLSGLMRTSFSRTASPQPSAPPGTDHGDQEIWRSQTFLEIIVEFWMNQNTLENNKHAFSQQVSPHSYVRGHPHYSKIDPYYYIMVESFLPSSDHVRIVRMVVKHLHFFANGAHIEIISSPYSSPVVSPLDELKRQVWPQLVQKRLYAFLRHGFERWPLDSSFRLILETWLSFVQPWRYTDFSQQNVRERDIDKDKKIDEKWAQFVADNLLFYTILFREFLPRVFRMDLCAPKNAYMLFRVSKVLNLPGLRDMIEKAETALYEPVQRVTMTRVHPMASMDLGASYLSPAHNPTNRAAMLNLQFTELETPGFVYKPFFSDETYRQVMELLGIVSQAKQTAHQLHQKNSENGGGSFWSWLGFGSAADYNMCTYAGYEGYDDFGGGDSRKLELHLDQATTNLCSIFMLQVPEDVKTVQWGVSSPRGAKLETLAPDYIDGEDGPNLTPLGRYQIANGLRKFDIQYRGDPDVQPIRSYENVFLVRMLCQLSSFINHKYSHEIEALYKRDDFLGRLAYQYFSPPQVSRSPPKPGRGSVPSPTTREQRQLLSKPRVSLRWLASYQNLGYIGAFYMMAYLWLGTGSVGCLLLLVLAGLIYGLIMTVLSPRDKLKRN